MRTLPLALTIAGAAGLAACASYAPAPAPLAVAQNGMCGSYGYVDRNNDGLISGDEWNSYRSGAYTYWDVNHDGRIDRTEFQNCWQAGGFYNGAYYQPTYWNQYWTAFDADGDGYLDANEYWSTNAWARIDRNHNGIMDSNEWNWWDM